MIREALAAAARNESLGGVLSRTPVAREVVSRVVGGDTVEDVVAVVRDLADRGFLVSIERTSSEAEAVDLSGEYESLVDALADSGLASVSEVSLLPEAFLGGAEPVASLSTVARRASGAGVAVMLGHGPRTDASLAMEWHELLHAEGLDVGVTLPAAVRATERLCAAAVTRVRLVKGGRGGRGPQSYSQPIEIDKAYVRCAKALMSSGTDASFATHDPRLIEILESLAVRFGRRESTYEYTFFMGRQESTQERLLAQGHQVRIYVPYGPQWFERLVGGLAEQPSSITAAVRSLLPGAS